MLLPYYIAAKNIEHEYMTLTGEYKPFDGSVWWIPFNWRTLRTDGLRS
jgi:predicted helicase